MIAVESFGSSSFLGEVWFAEADTPLGPWVYARKIVTHEKYSFYNPKQHPMFDKENGRIIYFEGTYTTMFSGNHDASVWRRVGRISAFIYVSAGKKKFMLIQAVASSVCPVGS